MHADTVWFIKGSPYKRVYSAEYEIRSKTIVCRGSKECYHIREAENRSFFQPALLAATNLLRMVVSHQTLDKTREPMYHSTCLVRHLYLIHTLNLNDGRFGGVASSKV